MKALFTDPVFVTAAITWIAQMILTPLVKRYLPPTNIAWVFIRAIHGLFDKIDPPRALPVIGLLVGLGATMLTQGCSHESARYRRAARSSFEESARMAQSKRPESECKSWDTIHVWGDWTAGISAGVGSAAAGLAAATDDGTQKAATGVAIGAGVVSAVSLAVAEQSSSSWVENCQ
jgi:hypothetical protein